MRFDASGVARLAWSPQPVSARFCEPRNVDVAKRKRRPCVLPIEPVVARVARVNRRDIGLPQQAALDPRDGEVLPDHRGSSRRAPDLEDTDVVAAQLSGHLGAKSIFAACVGAEADAPAEERNTLVAAASVRDDVSLTNRETWRRRGRNRGARGRKGKACEVDLPLIDLHLCEVVFTVRFVRTVGVGL